VKKPGSEFVPPETCDATLTPEIANTPGFTWFRFPIIGALNGKLYLAPVRLIAGWPWEKSRSMKVRAAQTALADFSQLSYIGVSAETDTERRKQNPNLTANDYIREGLQVQNHLLLLEAARVYPFSSLVANKGLVEIVQALQDRARKGDEWAKKTLIEWGRTLGAAGRGPKSAKTKQQQRKDAKDSEHVRRIKKQTARHIDKRTQKLVEQGSDEKTATQAATVWRFSSLQENPRIPTHRKRRVVAKV
jgi:hypothetical protein